MKTLQLIILSLLVALPAFSECRELSTTEHSCWLGGSYTTDCDCPKVTTCTPKTVYKTKWRTKIVEKKKEVIKEKVVKEEAPKNNLSLLGMRGYTGLDVDHTTGVVNSETTPELAVGLMYQRRFGNWRASIGAGTNGSAFLGFGRDF